MIKVWTSDQKNDDRLIGFGDNTIYKANPKSNEQTILFAKEMESGAHDSTKVWEIKTSHCKEIRLEDGKSCIEIFYGKEGEEQLRITDEYKRYAVFDWIKANTPDSEFIVEKWSAFRAGRKPMIAFIVVFALFVWTLYYAIQAKTGKVYYFENGGYFSVTGIVLGLASMGLAKVITLFSFFLGIALFAFIRKAKNSPIMNRIIIKK
jgi:hypothetical protein